MKRNWMKWFFFFLIGIWMVQSEWQFGGISFNCTSVTLGSTGTPFTGGSGCNARQVSLNNNDQSVLVLVGFNIQLIAGRDFNITEAQAIVSFQSSSSVEISAQLYNGTLEIDSPATTIASSNTTIGSLSFGAYEVFGTSYSNLRLGIRFQAQGSSVSVNLLEVKLRIFGFVNVVVSGVFPSSQIGSGVITQGDPAVKVLGNNFYDLRNNTSSKLICKFGQVESIRDAVILSPTEVECVPFTQSLLGFYPIFLNLGAGFTTINTVLFLYGNGSTCPQNSLGLCSGKGSCDPVLGECKCNPFWKGADCNTPNCSPYGDCSGNGNCIFDEVEGHSKCNCNAGFFGASCTSTNPDFDNCDETDFCSGEGICSNGECACNSGWLGVRCSIPDCSAQNWCNGQTCVDVGVCSCSTGYDLPSCTPICTEPCPTNQECFLPQVCACQPESEPPFCETLPPLNCNELNNCTNGQCFRDALSKEPFCVCLKGWFGKDCSAPDCISFFNNCSYPNGVCTAPNTCQCNDGFTGSDCSSLTQKGKSSSSDVGAIVGSIFAVLFVFLVIFVIAFIYLKKHPAGRRKTLKEPKYTEVAFANDSKAAKYVIEDEKYKKLEELLIEKDLTLVKAICAVTQPTEADNVSKGVVHLFTHHGQSLRLLLAFIDSELEESDTSGTLFRANSMATKMFKVFSKIQGLPYLWKTLAKHIDGIIVASAEQEQAKQEQEAGSLSKKKGNTLLRSSSINSFELEVDPSKMEEGADQIANKWQLLLIAQKIFTAITRSASYMPPSFRKICGHVYHGAESRFPGSEYKSLGGFLFLRFICPALVAPHTYALAQDPPSSSVQRELVLLSKILQNLANDAEFGAKEEYMAKLNSFVKENKPQLQKFYNEIVQLSEKDPLQDDPIKLPPNVRENALGFIHQHIVNNEDKIYGELESHPNGEKLKSSLKQILSNLGPPQKTK